MNKPSLILWLAIIIVVVTVSVAAVYSVKNRLFSPLVTVTVYNATKTPVEVNLTHKTGVLVVGTLKPGQKRTVRFDPKQAESTYTLSVDSGKRTMTGGGGYVESGYRMEETISATGIETKCNIL